MSQLLILIAALEFLAVPFAFGPIWIGAQVTIVAGIIFGVCRNVSASQLDPSGAPPKQPAAVVRRLRRAA